MIFVDKDERYYRKRFAARNTVYTFERVAIFMRLFLSPGKVTFLFLSSTCCVQRIISEITLAKFKESKCSQISTHKKKVAQFTLRV